MARVKEPIAIIGSGCRFPGESSSPSRLWDLLKEPRDVSRKIDRFPVDSFYHENGQHHGTGNVRHSYLLSEDVRTFDSQFFNVQAGEADSIDPQQRFLMEVIYESLESAGLRIEDLSGTATGVYVGVMCNDYSQITYADIESVPKYAATGTALSILSNRVSYFFNWTGPSMTLDTACSSSLIAVHQAVQLLRSGGESRVAVAAGTNLIFSPTNYVAESNLSMLSPTGRSRMWDAAADGYARGEGVASVVLKRLSDAIADGDTIECIIRETGINQDGRTPGITMPSSSSQADLIRKTYLSSGLDPSSVNDRCQYFEAHGTGTKAGDPQEARAISEAFYADEATRTPDNVLYVGSVKTVIGHTEGTAGIAGLLKASLSIQKGIIPPNMLFQNLNPDIAPFYGNLEILTSPRPWPVLPPGVPRRASVNSFGFGGANAHAIVEGYDAERVVNPAERRTITGMPFVFSANSERSLAAQLETYLSFLQGAAEDGTNLRDLTWTLSRRSAFGLRTSFSASTAEDLRSRLAEALEAKRAENKELGVRPLAKRQKILGIFTGQGAQWAAMGSRLVKHSPFVQTILAELESALQTLPEEDRPTWSLAEELSKDADDSRVMEGEFSQPLCTAVQIIMIDILSRIGVGFDAVAGHSSGEIAAAYAAGYLTAADAIRISYYRGVYGKLASGPGSMLAVGTSMEDADELCRLPKFRGRVNVAASNSSASVTIAGDSAAIDEAQFVFEDEGKFVRKLKVDTAYHSHHMRPCAQPYMEAMSRIQVQVQTPKSPCRWFSSVLGGTEVGEDTAAKLAGQYWCDNLVQPVLFSQSVEAALAAEGTPGLVLEVGPHPALKGPASLTIEEKCGDAGVAYSGVLKRGSDDIEALSAAVGAVWSHLGSSVVSFAELDSLFSDGKNVDDKPVFLKSAPTYTWDHERIHWNEPRLSRSLRLRQQGHHELLGVRQEGSVDEVRWRNFIKPAEMPWMRGHQVQGQMVFPAAGFAAMAAEAGKALVGPDEQLSLVELLDLRIGRAMSFPDENAGVESTVALTNIQRDKEHGVVFCDFECEICPTKDGDLVRASTCRIRLELGQASADTLPQRSRSELKMNMVEIEHFYDSLSALGYNYSDMFRGISSMERTTDVASGTIQIDAEEGYEPPFMIHPAPLDVAFQSIFGAMSSPGDGRLWTILVPTLVSRIKINPYTCQTGACLRTSVAYDAVIGDSPTSGVSGDVDLFNAEGDAMVQVEGLHVSPLTSVTERDDRQMFAKTIWDLAEPDATRDWVDWRLTEEEWGYAYFIERVCFFYVKRLHDAIGEEERKACEWHPRMYLEWAADIVEEVAAGKHPIAKKEWMEETWETLKGPLAEFQRKFEDFKYFTEFGDNLIPFVRGEVNLLELFRETGMLEYIYKTTYGFPEYNAYLGGLVHQVTHRLRQMDVLEIGAGTGSATEAIVSRIGDNYSSYTYTDISAGFFIEAQKLFKDHGDKFVYSTLDIEKDPLSQGYTEHSYDLIVASNVLHATKSLAATLSNVRKLLKPGGYLVMMETTDIEPIRPTFWFGALPGWWVGENDGRKHGPLVTQKGWDSLLRQTGFSGLDTTTPESGVFMAPQSVMLTQAVDTQISLIRQPLSEPSRVALDSVLILGGHGLSTFQLQEDIMAILQPLTAEFTQVEKLEDLEESHFKPKQICLSLLELDEPVFSPFTPEKWAGFQLLTEKSRNIVWITQGGRGEQPFNNMMIGVARCLVYEKQDLRFQLIDFEPNDSPTPQLIAEAVLRMHISAAWEGMIQAYNTAWTLEREIRVIDGKVTIPRLVYDTRLDRRYNSLRRVIRNPVNLSESVVSVTTDLGGHYELAELKPRPAWASQADLLEIEVHRSSLASINLGATLSLFLVIGRLRGSDQKVLAFSNVCRSTVFVPNTWLMPCDDAADEQDINLLAAAISVCMSETIVTRTPKDTDLLVHEPSRMFAKAVAAAAGNHNITVHFTTSDPNNTAGFKHIHRSIHTRDIWRLIPPKLSGMVDMSSGNDPGRVGARIEKQLPAHCTRLRPADLICNVAHIGTADNSQDAVITATLQRAVDFFKTAKQEDTQREYGRDNVEEVEASDVPKLASENTPWRAINWTAQPIIDVKLSPPEDEISFRPDGTYLLVGLASELGLSLCKWMVRRGARHVVLTSRNPAVDPKWLDNVQASGAAVHVLACDVTDKKSVIKMYRTICKTLPPIVGVANGAMVLNDGLVAQMSFDKYNATLRPKVEGTRFLDELFNQPTLDFFIVFSSLAYVTGNIGQSSYAAANGFMASIVEGRRRRGLAGSVMNLAGIFGIGYITRTDRAIIERLAKMGYTNISEWDYLQFFAEAVIAGRPDSGLPHEITSSLRPADPDQDANPPAWLSIPRFSYFKRTKSKTAAGAQDGKTTSVRAQLKEQTTKEGVYKVLLAGLTANLYKQLGLRPEDGSIGPSTRLIDLGIDSLVAVDMRFWFTKELDLDMPVLKLLGGASVEEMVEDTMERLSPEIVPNVPDIGVLAPPAQDPAEEGSQSDTPAEATEESSASEEPTITPADSSATDASVPSSTSSTAPDDAAQSEDGKVPAEAPPSLVFERKIKMAYNSLQFWFLLRHLDAPCSFNISFRFGLRGKIDIVRLQAAVRALGHRHDAFRTAFFADDEHGGEPMQGVLTESPLRLETRAVSSVKEAIEFNQYLDRQIFDIERGQVIRIALLSQSDTFHYLILSFHHIAMDGFSFNVLLSDLSALYEGRRLPPVAAQWTDLVAKQRQAVEDGSLDKEISFWQQSLGKIPDPIPLLPMARMRTRMPVTKYDFEEPPLAMLDEPTVRAIRNQCRKLKSTRFHFFMAAFRILLFRLVDVEEICIGITDANRPDSASMSTIGYLLNQLALKFGRGAADQTFADGVRETRDKAYAALAHAAVPFNALLDKLAMPRSSDLTPVFQVLLDYLPHRFEPPTGLGTPEDEVVAHLNYNFYDMILGINDISPSLICLRLRAQSVLYSRSASQMILDAYVRLLKMLATADPLQPLTKIELYDAGQVEAMLTIGRGPSVAPQSDPLTAPHIIDEVCARQPSAVALKDSVGNTLTYAQMLERVDTIASALLEVDLGSGSQIGVYQEPTADWLCSALAIWRVGYALVPLDSRLPTSRLATIVSKSCDLAVILCHQATSVSVSELGCSARTINVSNIAAQNGSAAILVNRAKADNLALMLFTSGSTGVPKGIEHPHSNLVNSIQGLMATHELSKETVLHQSASSFDLSVSQWLIGLCSGGSVYVAGKDQRGDPLEISNIIRSEHITCTVATPPEYLSWLQFGSEHISQASQWRTAMSGGETLTHALVTAFRNLARPIRLINIYGPAETIIAATSFIVDYHQAATPQDSEEPPTVPVGVALPNYAVYVVDKYLQPVPAGVSGEIVIAGASVGNGYYGQVALTDVVFVPDKLTPANYWDPSWLASSKMYRTGDCGRYGENDGQLYFEGRMVGETQVKIYGIRIEIEEVESAIIATAEGALSKAVVSVRRDPDFLVGHVQFSSQTSFSPSEQKTFLRSLVARLPLPRHMCPAVLVPLDAALTTSHFKTDRVATAALSLPVEEGGFDGRSGADDLTETENALKDIWTRVLPEECVRAVAIHPETEFFQLGGGSYLLILIQGLIRQRFRVSIPVMQLFDSSTLRAMATKIEAAATPITSIDWDAETALDDSLLLEPSDAVEKPARQGPKSVLLTGATGYLGRNLLQQLINSPDVGQIHCVAVRDASKLAESVRSHERVALHNGDLAAPLLGLAEDELDRLVQEADVIIHSGANRSFWDYYEALSGVNVGSTKALVRMAARHKVPLHFISSGGLVPKDQQHGDGKPAQSITALSDSRPPTDGSNGYMATKWAAEAYLEKAAASPAGAPVCIHRVVAAPGEVAVSAVEDLPESLVADFASLAARMRAVPRPGGWRGSFDIVRTSSLAAALVENALATTRATEEEGGYRRDDSPEKGARYVHYASDLRVDMQCLADGLAAATAEAGEGVFEEFERLPPHEWVGRAKLEGLDWHFSGQDFGAVGAEGFELRR